MIMYTDIVIPTYELALVMLTCIVLGYCIGEFIEKWRKMK